MSSAFTAGYLLRVTSEMFITVSDIKGPKLKLKMEIKDFILAIIGKQISKH